MLACVGVQYKRTGRWEAHIWDSSEPGAKKGRQLHLGSFPAAEPAAMYVSSHTPLLRVPGSRTYLGSVAGTMHMSLVGQGHWHQHQCKHAQEEPTCQHPCSLGIVKEAVCSVCDTLQRV